MYKKFFMGIAAMAALTLVSCSSEDLNSLSDNSSKNEAISFDGYLGRSAVAVNGSRGSVLEIADLQKSKDGFGVFGNYSSTDGATPTYGDNLFKNEQVTYSSSNTTSTKWAYKNTKYWPTEGHIDFLAYAPYVQGKQLTNNTLTNETSCIEFDVANKVAAQKDLLWANAVGQTKANNSGAKKVEFKFAHALSRLGYTVKLSEKCSSVATITLKNITLAGSAPAPTIGTTTAPTGTFYTKGTIDLATGNWISPSGKQYFNWYSAPTSGASEPSGTQPVTFTSGSAETYTSTDYLFVIPQNFKAENELYVIVEYTISYSGVTAKPFTYKVYQRLSYNFLQGKAYTINLTIGLTPIEFNADVTAWDIPTDGAIDINSWN